MKNIITALLLCCICGFAAAQKPHYLPGDGVYIVGLPADGSKMYDYPVMVTEAYQAKFKTFGAELASITAGKSYNISNRLQSDGTLDLISFMGTGEATNLIVRNFDGESYTIGDYAPNKTWTKSYLAAAFAPWEGKTFYTLGVYDHWDCPVTYAADTKLTEQKASGLIVDFGNPHEGLVCKAINFNLISSDADLKDKIGAMSVSIKLWDEKHESVLRTETVKLRASNVKELGTTEDGKQKYAIYVDYYPRLVIAQPFTVEVDGFDKLGTEAWIPRAVDTHNLYPTHTTYRFASREEQVATTDACINIDGYFNYVGTWGWPEGKEEYGECVAQGDYVQVYIDPSDPDWPGKFFTGEPTFPIECTFGISDLQISEKPDWINSVDINTSRWKDYGALLIIMSADALPSNENGRYGKVVVSTQDEASHYTIHIRQGNGQFPTAIDGPQVNLPIEGGMFDLSGRQITSPQYGQIYIKNGKKVIK